MNCNRGLTGILGVLLTVGLATAQAPSPTVVASKGTVWVTSWGASQQIPEPHNALSAEDLRDATVRQIFHLSVGGPALRVHVSNAFGTESLHITSMHVAHPVSPSSAAIDAATDHALTFGGQRDVTIPP